MLITIDTSVLIAVVAHEPERGRALEVTSGRHLVAPHSVHWEIGNAFSAMLKRRRVTLDQAKICLDAYAKIPIRLVHVDLKQALELAKRHQMYAYDAYLLACAMQFNAPLLSLDQSLNRVASSVGLEALEI